MAFTAKHKIFNWRTFWYCFFLSFSSLSYGYPASITATTLGQPVFLEYMHLMNEEGKLSPNGSALEGTTVGLFCAGGCIGVLIGSWSNDRFGRKPTMIVYAIIAIVGNAIVTASQNIAMFIVGRAIAGFAAIGFIALGPVYIAEFSQAETRGLFVGMTGVAIAIGYSVAAYVGLGMSYVQTSSAQWRVPLGIAMLWPTILLVVLLFTPESPRYLLLKDRVEEAWSILQKIHSDGTDENKVYIEEEFYQMRQQIEYDRTVDSTWLQMFKKSSYRKRLYMACGITFLGQTTAVLVAANYGPSLYGELGFGTQDSLILQCGWITGSIPAAIFAIVLVDRFGRKPFMFVGYVGCLASLVILVAMVAVYAPSGTNKVGLGFGVTALYLIVIFYCLGVEAVGSVFYSEIFPNNIRAKGVSFTVFVNSLTNLVYLEAAPTALHNIGWRFLLLFVCILAVGCVLFWWFIPETKGVPLEELAAIFGDTEDVKVYSAEIHVTDGNKNVLEYGHPGKEVAHSEQEEIVSSKV